MPVASERAVDALPGLARADRRRQLAPAERAAGEIRGGIRDPYDRHQCEQQPRRARLELHDRDPGREQHEPARRAPARSSTRRASPAASHAGATSDPEQASRRRRRRAAPVSGQPDSRLEAACASEEQIRSRSGTVPAANGSHGALRVAGEIRPFDRRERRRRRASRCPSPAAPSQNSAASVSGTSTAAVRMRIRSIRACSRLRHSSNRL